VTLKRLQYHPFHFFILNIFIFIFTSIIRTACGVHWRQQQVEKRLLLNYEYTRLCSLHPLCKGKWRSIVKHNRNRRSGPMDKGKVPVYERENLYEEKNWWSDRAINPLKTLFLKELWDITTFASLANPSAIRVSSPVINAVNMQCNCCLS
jgi:hypothetical protein